MGKRSTIGSVTLRPISEEELRRFALPIFWKGKAIELHRAAQVMWQAMMEDAATWQKHHQSLLNGQEDVLPPLPPDLGSSFSMLAALAIENLLKGIIVGQSYESSLSAGQLTLNRTHNLMSLAASAGVTLSDDETSFCQLGTRAILEWGRYPIPSNTKQQMTMEREINGPILNVFEDLYARLLPQCEVTLQASQSKQQ